MEWLHAGYWDWISQPSEREDKLWQRYFCFGEMENIMLLKNDSVAQLLHPSSWATLDDNVLHNSWPSLPKLTVFIQFNEKVTSFHSGLILLASTATDTVRSLITSTSVWKVVYFCVATSFIYMDLADIFGPFLPALLPATEEKHSSDWQVKLFKVSLLCSSPSHCSLLL